MKTPSTEERHLVAATGEAGLQIDDLEATWRHDPERTEAQRRTPDLRPVT